MIERKIIYVMVLSAVVLVLYAAHYIKQGKKEKQRMTARMENDRTVNGIKIFSNYAFEQISALANSGEYSPINLVKKVMEELGISAENLNRKNTAKLLDVMVQRYADPKQRVPITEEHGKLLIDYVYTNLQIGLGCGPEYKKFQKRIDKKLNSLSKKDIDKYIKDKYKDQYTKEMASDIAKSIKDNAARDIKANVSQNMHDRMQQDMQMQMQQSMQLEMQNQMMQDMQNQMMLDMQNQMMLDMQNQMQQQMQQDFAMQQQMQQDLSNTMHQSEMAITPMHDGGNMLDMNNMHMGGL